jgi:hypothetical protein
MVALNPRGQMPLFTVEVFAPADPRKTVFVRPHFRRPPNTAGERQEKTELDLRIDLGKPKHSRLD